MKKIKENLEDKKALNFGRVLSRRSFVGLVTILVIFLGLVTNVFLFLIQEVRAAAIDIGPGAVTRASTWPASYGTTLDKNNLANDTGILTKVEFFFYNNATGVKAGTAYFVSGQDFTTRDWEIIGNVASGSKQTFTGLDIDVQTGDYLGTFYSTGDIYRATSEYADIYYCYGDQWGTGQFLYYRTPGDCISIYGEGEPANTAPNATSVSDSPDPVAVGSNVTFTGEWTESDAGDNVKMYICDSSSCTNCTYDSTSSCWCYSDDWVTEPTTTDSCVYTAQSSDFGENDYWLGVCDDSDDCDATPYSGGTFTVATSTYDFTTGTSTDKWAYECGTATPTSPTDYEREATGAEYIAIESSNDSRWTTATATVTDEYDSQIYSITINEATSSISNITIEWEGYGETESSYNTTLYVWNTSTPAWVNLDTIDFESAIDKTASGTVSSSIEDYIDANSKLHILASTKKYVWIFGEATCNDFSTGWAWLNGACWSDSIMDRVSWNKGVGDDSASPGAYTCNSDGTLKSRMEAAVAGRWSEICTLIDGVTITSNYDGHGDIAHDGDETISALAISDCVDGTRDLCATSGCLGDNGTEINTALNSWATAADSKSSLPQANTTCTNPSYCPEGDYNIGVNEYETACVGDWYENTSTLAPGTNYCWAAACGIVGYSWATSTRDLGYANCSFQSYVDTSSAGTYDSFRVVVRP